MSVKKNLTVATLAALLAVPAFGATNASRALHMPSVTAHASSNYNWTNHMSQSPASYRNLMARAKSLGSTWNSNNDTENLNYGGHHYELTGTDTGVVIDGHPATEAQASAMLSNTNNSSTNSNNNDNARQDSENNEANGANQNNDESESDSTNESTNSTDSTQYASKKSLPQTSESNGVSKAMAMGAIALGASASFMALSMAKKHRQESELSAVSSEPTVDDGDGKSNNDSADDIDNCYHMIMSNTFANISEDLK